MTRHETSLAYAARIERVMSHIADHLDDRLELDDLSDIACFSPYHFHRVFVAVTGETVAEAVRRLRLHRAAVELNRSQHALARIATRAGYGSVAAFTRAFSSAYGLPPAAYRRAGQDLRPVPQQSGSQAMTRATTLREALHYDVAIENVPKLRLVTLPHRGDYQKIGVSFERLFAWAGGLGLLGQGARMIGIYYDDPDSRPLAELRSEAGLAVPEDSPLGPEMAWREVGGGPVARLVHKGPYADLDIAYAYLYHSWLPHSGRQPGDAPCFEEYLNDPRSAPPSEWLTAVNLPLK
ncbi:helix-turn-helix domain-containing protein [Labrys sp. KNU-23]|uniref:AraC family transcriptional regulator n=1 Tax=Labrys sp. KNU-23 TaxID=2789216 RepID=UPI0011EEFCD7|nr:GyrI-like domain-containing protein [Labrys sp. KNU-23]QEN90771.1 helix-turn-helix domain-containing protein [Labrys sp. KNU-23]